MKTATIEAQVKLPDLRWINRANADPTYPPLDRAEMNEAMDSVEFAEYEIERTAKRCPKAFENLCAAWIAANPYRVIAMLDRGLIEDVAAAGEPVAVEPAPAGSVDVPF